jgi:hypothetical protein
MGQKAPVNSRNQNPNQRQVSDNGDLLGDGAAPDKTSADLAAELKAEAADKAAADKAAADKAAADKAAAKNLAESQDEWNGDDSIDYGLDRGVPKTENSPERRGEKSTIVLTDEDKTYSPKENEKHLVLLKINSKGFDERTSEPFTQFMTEVEFKAFQANVRKLGYEYKVIYAPIK